MTDPSRRPLIVGNWKMNLGEGAARSLVSRLASSLPFDRVDAAVAPAFPCLRAALDAASGTSLAVGAQNLHFQDRGAYTGEVAPGMLAEMGIRFVIVGHSERRAQFGETDAIVSLKIGAARRHGLVPIVCVGETESQHDRAETHDVIEGQIAAAFASAQSGGSGEAIVAYEPVWAIGTGRTPSPADVTQAHGTIREALRAALGTEGNGIRILYGGSVTPANAESLFRAPGVDGALVGGASLDVSSFEAIARFAS